MKPDWHHEEVKAQIRKRGITMKNLSEIHGYKEDACRRAIKQPWPAVERIIADFLGLKPQAIWPSRYDAAGRPVSRIYRESKSTNHRRRRHCQK